MVQVAIIVSPGHNTEIETYRDLKSIGMDAKIYKWNDDPTVISKAESFVIPGGFSFEDRGRSGLIAAQYPVMKLVAEEAAKGKPVIGICNGAQSLVEMKLIPGDEDKLLALALAKNKRVKDGEILGTGFYNDWVYVKLSVDKTRTPFTHLVDDKPYAIPVAHGEGRYMTAYPDLPNLLKTNNQVIFKYCNAEGTEVESFPVNPNGAMFNAAAISNPEGNVVSIMPHPERGIVAPILDMFKSLKFHLENKPALTGYKPYKLAPINNAPGKYHSQGTALIIKEIITDNEAFTLENTLKKILKNPNIKLRRYSHYEIIGSDELNFRVIHESGEIYNSNKEMVMSGKIGSDGQHALLVRYRDDFEGESKKNNLNRHYGLKIDKILKGTLWVFEGAANMDEILKTDLFYNINSQIAYEYL